MEQSSMTALVSAFARAYHFKNNRVRIFNDSMAERFLTEKEYSEVSLNMSRGISFFNPSFEGSSEEALRWIVDNHLSPTPLGRSAYAEKMLENAVKIGAKQYLIFAAGFDTFAYRQPVYANNIRIFEIDHPLTSEDKQKRAETVIEKPIENLHYIQADLSVPDWGNSLLSCPSFVKNRISFCSLLGLSYYLSKKNFENFVHSISDLIPYGSSIIFDYPDENSYTKNADGGMTKQASMASSINEPMKACYSYTELEKLLSDYGFLIYEHLEPEQITNQYFREYNLANPKYPIKAPDNVNYCLGVKK